MYVDKSCPSRLSVALSVSSNSSSYFLNELLLIIVHSLILPSGEEFTYPFPSTVLGYFCFSLREEVLQRPYIFMWVGGITDTSPLFDARNPYRLYSLKQNKRRAPTLLLIGIDVSVWL